MGTAQFIKNMGPNRAGSKQRLYRLDPPLEENAHVIVSAVFVPFSGPETYIFPADPEGNITDRGELNGSYRGGMDHAEALRRAGYDVIDAKAIDTTVDGSIAAEYLPPGARLC